MDIRMKRIDMEPFEKALADQASLNMEQVNHLWEQILRSDHYRGNTLLQYVADQFSAASEHLRLGVMALQQGRHPVACSIEDAAGEVSHVTDRRFCKRPGYALCGHQFGIHNRITPITAIPQCPECLRLLEERTNA